MVAIDVGDMTFRPDRERPAYSSPLKSPIRRVLARDR